MDEPGHGSPEEASAAKGRKWKGWTGGGGQVRDTLKGWKGAISSSPQWSFGLVQWPPTGAFHELHCCSGPAGRAKQASFLGRLFPLRSRSSPGSAGVSRVLRVLPFPVGSLAVWHWTTDATSSQSPATLFESAILCV